MLPIKKDLERGFRERNALMPLYCVIQYAIEQDMTVEEAAAHQAKLYNFEDFLTKRFRDRQTEHELSHLLIAMAFAKIGCDPTGHDFGHNGNNQAEAIAISIEKYLHPDQLLQPFVDTPLHADGYAVYCANTEQKFKGSDGRTLQAAVDLINASEAPLSIAEARRSVQFKDDECGPPPSPLTEFTKFGEKIPSVDLMPREKVNAVFAAIFPAISAIHAAASKHFGEQAFASEAEKSATLRHFLKHLKVADLQKAMQTGMLPDIDASVPGTGAVFVAARDPLRALSSGSRHRP